MIVYLKAVLGVEHPDFIFLRLIELASQTAEFITDALLELHILRVIS